MAPPGPVKIGHKKDGCQRRPHRFHVSRPPLTRPLGSATGVWKDRIGQWTFWRSRILEITPDCHLGDSICQVTMTTKAAIVTGGAQGIGKAIAGTLLTNGYKVRFLKICLKRESVWVFSDFLEMELFSFHNFFRLFYSDINPEKLSSNNVYFEATEKVGYSYFLVSCVWPYFFSGWNTGYRGERRKTDGGGVFISVRIWTLHFLQLWYYEQRPCQR